MGGGAVRLKYICDMKIRVVGYAIVKDAPLETREAIMWYVGKTESFKQV